MHPPFSFPLAEKRMRRAQWKRKGTESKLAHLCKFGECGSQLFCSEICFLLRGTGGVRISFSLVHRADSHMKPRDANRTPSASLSAAAPAHLQSRVVRSEAERTGLLQKAFQVCSPVNALLPNVGKHSALCGLSAQPAEGFRILAAVRTDCSFVWVSWPLRRSTHP